jgi:hypothetical protein
MVGRGPLYRYMYDVDGTGGWLDLRFRNLLSTAGRFAVGKVAKIRELIKVAKIRELKLE